MSRPTDNPNSTAAHGHPETTPDVPAALPAVPGYDLLNEVGKGGMGVVYRARDLALGRDVAVKVLQDRFAPGSGAARRFVEEAHITGQLQHPGIPPVHAVGECADGRPFLAMKLIKGRTLDDLLADGNTPRGSLVAAFEQVCQAVAYAHNHGVVHRDLKPANVMVGSFGEVQVMDWGLAKVLADRGVPPADPDATAAQTDIRTARDGAADTQAGSILGTPAYMPPEQAIGAVDQIDARSDVFGLGAILCVILTGHPPYVGGDAESTRRLAARARLGDALARLDDCGADPGLATLCKRCLAAEPADRPADAGAVAAAVAALRAAADDRARQAELDKVRAEGELRAAELKAAEERKRRRVRAALVATLLLAGLGAGAAAGAWAWDREARRAAARAEAERAVSSAVGEAEAVRGSPDDSAGDPRRWLDRLDAADAALAKADPWVAAVGDPALRDRAAELRAALAADRRDATLLSRLDAAALLAKPQLFEFVPDAEAAVAAYAAAFREYGWDPDQLGPDEFADRLTASPHRRRLLRALDRWCYFCRRDANPDRHDRLVRATVRAAPNLAALTSALADAITSKDRVGADAAAGLLAAAPDLDTQAPTRIAALAAFYAISFKTTELPPGLVAGLRAGGADDFWTLFHLAQLYGSGPLRDVPRSVGYLRAALAVRPDAEPVQFFLLAALVETGDADEVDATATAVLARRPGFGFALLCRAAARSQLGRWRAAEADLRAAATADPGSADPLVALAEELLAAGRADDAAAAAEQALSRPDSLNARAGKMLTDLDALTRGADLPGLRELIADAAGAIPDMAELARVMLARARLMQGRPADAVAALREAVAARPKSSLAHYWLSVALLDTGDLPAAAAAAADCKRTAVPGVALPHAPDRWADFLAQMAALDAQWPTFDRTGERWPADATEAYTLAAACRLRGRPIDAVDFYRQAFRDQPDWEKLFTRDYAHALALVFRAEPDSPYGAATAGLAVATLGAQMSGRMLEAVRGHSRGKRIALLKDLAAWRADPGLVPLRDPTLVARLPAKERAVVEKFWADLDSTRADLVKTLEP